MTIDINLIEYYYIVLLGEDIMIDKEKLQSDYRDEKYYKKLTLPNVLTVFRIISSLSLCGYIAKFGITSPLLITLSTIGIGATDALDGYLARNCGMSSRLGSMLDPIADKIYNWGIGITLMASGIMPLWPLLILVRDASVFGLTTYQFKKTGKEMKPTIPAKLKMVFQSMGLVSTLAFGFGSFGVSLIAPICMGTAIATAIPEAICIKKKYFNKEEEISQNIPVKEEQLVYCNDESNINEIKKSKTLEYNSLTYEYANDKPKIKKKTLFK